MASHESFNGQEEGNMKGNDNEPNGLDQVNINLAYCKFTANGENDVELIGANSQCLYYESKDPDTSDTDCLGQPQLNGTDSKHLEADESTADVSLHTHATLENNTLDNTEKDTASPINNSAEMNKVEVQDAPSTENGSDSESLQFESYNKVCPKIQEEKVLDQDFHRTPKEFSFVDDSEEIPEKKLSHKGLCHGEKLEWFDTQHQADTIHRLNVFRKSRKFCDLVLLVGGHELYCHRVVVGGGSRAIFDELCRGEQESGPIARIPIDASKPGLSPAAVEILIEYMYTSRLLFACQHLTAVYRAALQLGVERVIPICRRRVTDAVDTEQCIQMRRLAQNYGDIEMKTFMDHYIEENMEAISGGIEFLSLPRINIEVIISPNASVVHLLSINLRDGLLSSTALVWISNIIKSKGGGYLEDLTEQIQRIPLEDLNNAPYASNEHGNVFIRRVSQEAEHRKASEGSVGYVARSRLTRSSSMDSIKSSDSNDSVARFRCDPDGEWKTIASLQVRNTEHMIALCCLGDVLCALSIRVPGVSSPNRDLTNGHDIGFHPCNQVPSVSSSSASCCSSLGSFFQFCPMNQPRSAAGVAQIDGKIIVAGGFNQSESLDSVEYFDVTSNRWSGLSRMSDKRGRFSVAVLGGQLYAVGGSTGSHDLNSVERYDPANDTWTHVQSLQFCCSAAGVAVLNGRLYCVGGVRQSISIAGLKACQVYDPNTDKWDYAASMHTGRCSLGVAALGDHLYAVAGSDGWKCLSSAEKYDPVTKHWTFTAPLNMNRRGLGLTEHNGFLYCVGGSDGQSFLSSVERFNPAEGDTWTLTSWTLGVPRNCAGVTSANGSVFVVGGFSGRQFLSSVEAVEDSASEWSPHDSPSSKNASSDAKDSSSSD